MILLIQKESKMQHRPLAFAGCLITLIVSQASMAGTDVYFNPLTQSSAVASPNHMNELNSPWQAPAGISQANLISMTEIEADATQSVLRVPDFGSATLELIASMWAKSSFDDTGKFTFIPHETFVGAGASRYDIEADKMELLFSGDLGGFGQNWDNDWAAFDPSLFTPMQTLLLGEGFNGEGRIIEVVNPFAPVPDIEIREVESLLNLNHSGLRMSSDGKTMYMADDWNSGSVYKFVAKNQHDFSVGQTFALSVDGFAGDAADLWNDPSNEFAVRTGPATWTPLTDTDGIPLTVVDPFRNGPTNDPRDNTDTRGGRPAADEVGATPYGRPEDLEVGQLSSGNEVVYFTASSENAIYSIEIFSETVAEVRLMASEATTPKNEGFPATTGMLNAPDNLAQDALGNVYVIEDAPDSADVGGDVWFLRDVDGDGVAESLDHFLSLQVSGSEATGMIFNPIKPTEFLVSVQHPDSMRLSQVPDGIGDALWVFDLTDIVPPPCPSASMGEGGSRGRGQTCSNTADYQFIKLLNKAGDSN
jgi:hypothetical protein